VVRETEKALELTQLGAFFADETAQNFHSPDFVRQMFCDFEILEHDATEQVAGFHQDTWVIAKPND